MGRPSPSNLPAVNHTSRRALALASIFGLSLLSCGRDVTGPGNGVAYGSLRVAALAIDPRFPAVPGTVDLASDVAPFERVRVVLQRPDGSVVRDTVIAFPATADSVALTLEIPLPLNAPDSGVALSLRMAYVNAAGDTVFRGGPLAVTARPAGSAGSGQQVTIPVVYTGTGASAAAITLTPDTGTVVSGTTTPFTAVARDGQGAPIANTPVVYSSPDTTRAVVASPSNGLVTWRAQRGITRIVATLLNGPADTSSFFVSLPASQILIESGDAQSATTGSALAAPLVFRVAASDSIGVAGIPVTFAVTTGGGTLTASADTSDANGLVTTSWTLGALVGSQSIIATATGIAGATRVATATGLAPLPAQVVITASPDTVVAGAAFPAVTVEARDGNGVLTSLFTGPVTIALDAGATGATLAGTATVNAVAGIATFSDLSIQTAANGLTLIASSGALTVDTSTALAVIPAAPAALSSVSGSGQSGTVGAALAAPFVVRVADAFGNGVPGVSVSWAIIAGTGTLGAPSTLTDVTGQANTLLTLPTLAGAVGVEATATGVTGSPQGFVATAQVAAPTQLAFTVQTASVVAGGAIIPGFTVEARDGFGNVDPAYTGAVTLTLSGGNPLAVLGGTSTVNAVAGVATFADLTIDLIGTGYVLNASAGGLTGAASGAIAVTASTPATMAVSAGDSQVGTVLLPLIDSVAFRVTDAFGNPVTGAAVTVAVTTGGGGVSPAGGPTDANGEVRTAWTLGAALGAQSITATVTGFPAVQTAASATANAGGAVALVIASIPLSMTAGQAGLTATVEARDAGGNLATSFIGDVIGRVETGPTAGTDSAVVTAVGGVAFFPEVLFDKAGVYTVRFTAAGLTDALSGSITVTAGAAAQILMDTVSSGDLQTGSAGAALPQPLRVLVGDSLGNAVSGATVVFTTVSGADTVGVDSTVSDAAGLASATPTMPGTLGAVTILATSTGLTGSPVTFTATVAAGAPASLAITAQPADVVAGAAVVASAVVARDSFGNDVNTFAGTITVAVDSGPVGGTISGTLAVAASAGAATFSDLTLDLVGTYRLRYTAAGLADAVSNDLVVSVAAANSIALVDGDGQSATVASFVAAPLRVRVSDAFGNDVSGVVVAWVVTGGGASLSADSTITGPDGIAAVSLGLSGAAGVATVDASVGGLNGSPVSFTATGTPDAAFSMVLGLGPDTTTSGLVASAFLVEARDQYGNLATGFTGDVTVSENDTPGTFSSGTRTVAAIGGVATFADLVFSTAGPWYISFDATGLGSLGVSVEVVANTAGQLALTTPAMGAASGAAFATQPVVEIRDANSNLVVTDNTTSVTMTVDGGATVVGTATATAVGGVVTFADVGLSGPAATYTLTFSSGVLSVATQSIDLGSTPAPLLAWTGAVDNNWSNTGNWSLGRLPLATDSVVVDPTGTDTVNVDVSSTVAYLIVGQTGSALVTHTSGATLQVDSAAIFFPTSTLTMAGGSVLQGEGGVLILGDLQWNGGTMAGVGATIVNGTTSIATSGNVTLDDRAFSVGGTATVGGFGIGTAGAPTIAVSVGGVLEFQSPNSLFMGGGTPDIVNAGTLRKLAAAGTVRVDWPIANTGTIDVEAGLLDLRNTLTDLGSTVVRTGGTLASRGQTDLFGSMDVQAGGTLEFSSGGIAPQPGEHVLNAGSSLTGLGTVAFNSANLVDVQGAFDIDSLTILNGTAQFNSVTDTAFVTNGAYLGGGFLSGTGVLAVRGAFSTNTGNMNGTGAIAVLPGASLALQSPVRGWNVDVAGTLVWGDWDLSLEPDPVSLQEASINIRAGGLFDLQHGATTRQNYGTTANVITNAGTIRKSGSATTTVRAFVVHTGLIDVLGGTLNLQGSCTVTGGTKTGAGTVTGCTIP